ncbi:ketosteroid isomerase-like protein [Caulobacter ginsengisoli]|uniref:Ketosteroid isomerase-like protein n=1 Tax=Caulobacter ginsengisoli TaxID=400775 RepID=A0ABU0IVS9_9CAUL|nr:nuclear transport factor 2 family protein [Caulobacter ginsengisoli]MDQ0466115.1 ketosteroid isomerase-like protein [Caulobacter ginsengisoli]
MIEIGWARAWAEEWIAAWNSGDLDRILSHYSDDFTMTSPYIVERMGVASSHLVGKAAVRDYWAKGLAIQPPLRFVLTDVVAGVSSLAIYYASNRGKQVVEKIDFDAAGRAIRGEALQRPAD